mgnify:CR=1 FL=1
MTTNIAWAEETWNPTVGCSKVAAGCRECYAETMSARLRSIGRPEYQDVVNDQGRWTGKVVTLTSRLSIPLSRRKPTLWFVDSMSDLFHEDIPDHFLRDVFRVMRDTPRHRYIILTKRHRRIKRIMQPIKIAHYADFDHVMLGCSISNEEDGDECFESLLALSKDGWKTCVSYEPALGPWHPIGFEFLEWIVAGGESGPNRRPCEISWFENVYAWTRAQHVWFFMKQDSAARPGQKGRIPDALWAVKEPAFEEAAVNTAKAETACEAT